MITHAVEKRENNIKWRQVKQVKKFTHTVIGRYTVNHRTALPVQYLRHCENRNSGGLLAKTKQNKKNKCTMSVKTAGRS